MTTATDAISYGDLYARWERGNWRASEIDFSEDALQWREKLSDLERRAALWNYALFFGARTPWRTGCRRTSRRRR